MVQFIVCQGDTLACLVLSLGLFIRNPLKGWNATVVVGRRKPQLPVTLIRQSRGGSKKRMTISPSSSEPNNSADNTGGEAPH